MVVLWISPICEFDFFQTERNKYVRFRDTKKERLQTPVEMLRWAPLIFPTGSDGTHAGELRRSEFNLVKLQIQVQVCYLLISDLRATRTSDEF